MNGDVCHTERGMENGGSKARTSSRHRNPICGDRQHGNRALQRFSLTGACSVASNFARILSISFTRQFGRVHDQQQKQTFCAISGWRMDLRPERCRDMHLSSRRGRGGSGSCCNHSGSSRSGSACVRRVSVPSAQRLVCLARRQRLRSARDEQRDPRRTFPFATQASMTRAPFTAWRKARGLSQRALQMCWAFRSRRSHSANADHVEVPVARSSFRRQTRSGPRLITSDAPTAPSTPHTSILL